MLIKSYRIKQNLGNSKRKKNPKFDRFFKYFCEKKIKLYCSMFDGRSILASNDFLDQEKGLYNRDFMGRRQGFRESFNQAWLISFL